MTTTTENIRTWATTKAGNASADAGITSADTQSPDTLDDNVRSIMASVRRESDDRGGAIVAGGTATALTATTASGIASGHIANGLRLCVRTASAATGAATIAVDGLTATTIKKADGTAVVSGDWASGQILDLVYSSTASAFLIANVGTIANLSITALSEDTAPDLTADFIPTYDTSAAGNAKVKPKNLYPSKQACFRASKSASQTVSSAAETTVTFDTEQFDIGSAFASNTWTPPAGKVVIGALVRTSAIGNSETVIVRIKKDGSAFAEHECDKSDSVSTTVFTSAFTTIDDANGSNAYTVTVQSSDTSYTVTGAQTYYSHFFGYMI